MIGITTEFIDCVYQVNITYTLEKDVIGVGNTTVRRVLVNVGNISTEIFSSSLITFDSSTFTFDTRTFTVYVSGISSALIWEDLVGVRLNLREERHHKNLISMVTTVSLELVLLVLFLDSTLLSSGTIHHNK